MKNTFLLFLFLFTLSVSAQITGKITSADGEPIPFASVVVKDTYNGTSSNEDGFYTLTIKQTGSFTIIFQSLGYKTREIKATVKTLPYNLDVILQEEKFILNEVVISSEDNPANAVIKQAIAHREENFKKTARFEADFYSRGVFRVNGAPEKILGQSIGDLGATLDSTRSGILYLSETFSKVKYSKPGKISERVIASKVSGDDNGYSFNNAAAAEFDFYENYTHFEVNVVSPIADNAFNYYTYLLESTFYDADEHLINKIKVTPKRENEAAMAGYIYIVENSWEIYAVELSIKGSQIQQPLLNTLTIEQNYGYNSEEKLWTKNVQTLKFDAGVLGIGFSGSFGYVYSNFNFQPEFDKKTFTNEKMSFEEEANKKENSFWNTLRPIPLTPEEAADYTKKDSIQELRKSRTYTDSIDARRNRFKLTSLITGYTYHNSYENWQLGYRGIIKGLAFNTVQAYHLSPEFYYTKRNPEDKTFYTIGTRLDYGFAEKRFRATGTISKKFNNFTNATLTLTGGTATEQFNPERPINRIVNSISTLFFRENYMKLYDRKFIKLAYQEEVVNGLYVYANAEYTERRSLFNNTDFSTLKDIYNPYLSNNPLAPFDYDTPAFRRHDIFIASVGTRITFAQKYWTRPDGKINLPDETYPRLYFNYEKGFGSSIDDYNFDHLSAKVTYDVTFGNKGETAASIRGGKFFNSDNIAFTDYRHFNGNQTRIGKSERYTNVFNLLPYYTHSTNDQYFEGHVEHTFKGYITNKIPLLNKLNYHLVVGYHVLSTPERNPYSEYTVGFDNLGWGKFRFLRIDYVRSYENGFLSDGVIFGLTFLNILE